MGVREDEINRHIVAFGGQFFGHLFIKSQSDFKALCFFEQAIVKAFAMSEAIAFEVEGKPWNHDEVDALWMSEVLGFTGFKNADFAGTEFIERVEWAEQKIQSVDFGCEHRFAEREALLNCVVGGHFFRSGDIKKDAFGVFEFLEFEKFASDEETFFLADGWQKRESLLPKLLSKSLFVHWDETVTSVRP